jgi:hypothetical protein
MSETVTWSDPCDTVTTTSGNVVVEAGCPAPATSIALSGITQSGAVLYDSIQWDGTAWVPIDLMASANRIVIESDLNSLGEFASFQTGTGAGSSLLNSYTFDGHIGYLTMSTGSTTTGFAGVGTSRNDGIVLGTFATESCDIVRLPILSGGTETYYVDCGLSTNRTGGASAPVDGVYFSYSHGLNSGKWQCCCMNNNTITTADSGITVAANTWYRLDIKIGTTTALFYINKVLVATVAGIPIGTSRTTGKHALIRKAAGTASMSLINDYTHIIQGTNR